MFSTALRASGTAVADAGDQMQIAVAHMAEHHKGCCGPSRQQRFAHLANEAVHFADPKTDIEGEERRVAHDLHDIVAQRP